MDAILKWTSWQFEAGDGPIEIRVTGNADTRVSTTFYWYPVSLGNPPVVSKRPDDVPMLLQPEQLVDGGSNQLGFHFTAMAKEAANRSLVVTFSARQSAGKRTAREQLYQYDLTGDDNLFVMSDGIKVAA